MNILVTGGAGFIGSHLVASLLKFPENKVYCLDDLTYAGDLKRLAVSLQNPLFKFVKGNICDTKLVENLLCEFRPDILLNLAAETHVDNSISKPQSFIHMNILGVEVLLQSSLRYWRDLTVKKAERFRFYQISTDEVYGDEGKANEVSAYRPSSPYSASKASADHLVRAWHRTYGLPVLISTASNNYGPWQHSEKLIPAVVKRILAGDPVLVYGSGNQTRDWLYVQDHVRAIETVMRAGSVGETYIVSTGVQRQNLEVISKIAVVINAERGVSAKIEHIADRPGHDLSYSTDSSKIRDALGWSPEADFDSALRNTVLAYLRSPEMLELN